MTRRLWVPDHVAHAQADRQAAAARARRALVLEPIEPEADRERVTARDLSRDERHRRKMTARAVMA